jgi:uncharacterized membrane protein YfcA
LYGFSNRIIAGLTVGFIVGLTGVGGGSFDDTQFYYGSIPPNS